MTQKISVVKKWILLFFICFSAGISTSEASEGLRVGWANIDITPSKPVLLRGQFYARLSERVLDPISATALSLESTSVNNVKTRIVMVSCDLIAIPDFVRDRVRMLVNTRVPELNPTDITISATHTHTAPLMSETESETAYGIPFAWITGGTDAMTAKAYYEFLSEKVAQVVVESWRNRVPGGISYGLGKAVLGHNRLHVNKAGKSTMYGATDEAFSHVEGYEDHNLNLMYTWDTSRKLTGIVINAAVTAQVSGHLSEISADFWTEANALLREELAQDLFILPQVSAAGDQSPWTTWDEREEVRMQELMGFGEYGTGRRSIGRRKQIARHITDGVKAIIPYMKENIEWNPVIAQQTEIVPLSRRSLGEVTKKVQDEFQQEMFVLKASFDEMMADIAAHPEKRVENNWYKDISIAFTRYNRAQSVYHRYQQALSGDTKYPVEVKVIRIGDMGFATNPFELYLDYGLQMKTRSPAIQTFVVQLTGDGTYVPTQRSIDGGAYGSVPASTLIGPDGGKELVEKTLEMLHSLWP